MKFIKILFLFITLSQSFNSFAQETSNIIEPSKGNKGKMYIFWGWNRAHFTHSDIRFRGNNYDFTLKNVVAFDRQTPFALDPYLHPTKLSIPQTNLRIGYFISEHYNISFGADHMKYVMEQNQEVKINGVIKNSETRFDGNYTDKDIVLTDDFLTFEHTDGLNYLSLAISRVDKIFNFNQLRIKNFEINFTEGVGIGALMPRTNTQLLKNKRYDEYHFAGYGLDAKIGLNILFYKHFFIQSELKGGYINMPDIRTTESKSDKAAQHFFYVQNNIVFGALFRLTK